MRSHRRCCPKCGSTEFHEVRELGLAPLNIWTDIVCNHCNYQFSKGSLADKVSKKLARKMP